MATDGPTPPRCSPECMEGPTILMTHTVRPNATEKWVKKLSTECGYPVDWSFAGGRIMVRTVVGADMTKVKAALAKLKPEWDKLYRVEDPDERYDVPWMLFI